MKNINFKVQFSEFIKKYGTRIFIVTVVVIIILLINYLLKFNKKTEPKTTKEPFAVVMKPGEKFPSKIVLESRNIINDFGDKCIEGNYEEAYNLLSVDCQSTVFGGVEEFKKYAKTNFPKGSRYEVIPYSKVGTTYIYQVKVYEDFLATGATNNGVSYIDLKMAINEDIKGNKLLSVAGFMAKIGMDSVFENDYIKVELKNRTSFYAEESYDVVFTNRTENEIVIRDFQAGDGEIVLDLGGDLRKELKHVDPIILKPFESKTTTLVFARFFDESTIPNAIIFPKVRIVREGKAKNYRNDDILASFSVSASIVK